MAHIHAARITAVLLVAVLFTPVAVRADQMLWHTPLGAYTSAALMRVTAIPEYALRVVSASGAPGYVYVPLVVPSDVVIDSVFICYERPMAAATSIAGTRLLQLREPAGEVVLYADALVRTSATPTCYAVDVADVSANGALFLELFCNVTTTFYIELGAIGVKVKPSATAVSYGDAVAPKTFDLFQNSPNPLRGGTTIEFHAEIEGRARLSVFDASGRRIRTLIDADVQAGSHQAVWDGRADDGRAAASGVYFYQLEMNGAAQGKQMVRLP